MICQDKEVVAIIEQVVDYAKQHTTTKQKPVFFEFIQTFFRNISYEDLAGYSIASLYGIAMSQWSLMSKREPGEILLRVFNPDVERDGWHSTHTVIELAIDDMPFLVDSMSMELTRLGITIHQMIYLGGIKCVHRDGELIALKGFSDEDEAAVTEAPIMMEIDRQNDADTLKSIQEELLRVINDVKQVVKDWPAVQSKMQVVINEYSSPSLQKRFPDMAESRAFLEWMLNDRFTFLGFREYVLVGEGDKRALQIVNGTGLGVLYDDNRGKQIRQYSDLPEEARRVALSDEQCLTITKTNTRSTVHRPAYTDYVGVKRFDESGKLIGEYRIIGLYTSVAYSSSPLNIPFLRHKINKVMGLSNLPQRSHAGKDLMHILATFPRDDLLHASAEEIYSMAVGIMRLQERRRIRMFARKDIYGRFVSMLVFVPRENFNTALAERMRQILGEETNATEIILNTRFSESVLARLHFIARIDSSKQEQFDFAAIEQRLVAVGQSWQDALMQHLAGVFDESRANELMGAYRAAFPAGFREEFIARDAVRDIEHLQSLCPRERPVAMYLYRAADTRESQVKLKLFHPDITVPLSDAVPVLENMGFRVLGETSYRIVTSDKSVYWINVFSLESTIAEMIDIDAIESVFYEAMLQLWQYRLENDGFNKLVVASKLNWHAVALLRAYAKYFRQISFSLSQQYIEQALVANHELTTLLIGLFRCRFDPEFSGDRAVECKAVEDAILTALDDVQSLDQDRIFRMYISVIYATVRTSFYQETSEGEVKPYISLKIDSTKVPSMPLPMPAFEAFVYSPRFEGVHLRSSKVARGGIRWSDRMEDFRVEVLGLMKAQQVKNALIVPSGAKGGFVTKRTTASMDRETFLAEGISCYQDYIRGLFDVTDNRDGETVVYHDRTVRHDGDDAYLVVAADKGTATFSDIANEISLHRGYWLGDAFASGGSAGYDHKKMGITAHGAWVSAQRHFLEMGVNADKEAITVVGIGDLAGDVFGNGVLMSSDLKLVAAFNHMHIFLDPDPDPKASYKERKRMFALPRSSWDDYDRSVVSTGGGIYKRSAKSIRLTPEIKQLLGLDKDVIVPNDLIVAILKARVDLVWNGGIGTFIKGRDEDDADVGDRLNDHIRINGGDLRAKVLCEGGNLGVTQLGRIEFEQSGGRVNTDFIDNSAGVDCSDHEVNIKILLNPLVKDGLLTYESRNELLEQMTNEVSRLVLKNNYRQNQALSLLALLSPKEMTMYARYLEDIESKDLINRELEFLPSTKQILERKSVGKGLTRPELAVLFSYGKNILKAAILDSSLLDDPVVEQLVFSTFPDVLAERYATEIRGHRLKREIVATQLASGFISDMGIGIVYQMQDETGASVEQILRAYMCAKEIFNINASHQIIESLDYKVSTDVQYQMMLEGVAMVRRAIGWLLRHRFDLSNIQQAIDHFQARVEGLFNRLPKLLVGRGREAYHARVTRYVSENVPESVAAKVARAMPLYHALNIVQASTHCGCEIYRVAKIYFMLVDRLELLSIRDYINNYPVDSRWAVLAQASFKADLDWVQREMVVGVLEFDTKARSIPGRILAWLECNAELVERARHVVADMRSSDVPDFAILSVALRELKELAGAREQGAELQA